MISGALRGAGDTKSPMYITAVGRLLFRILPAYILGFGLKIPPSALGGSAFLGSSSKDSAS